MVHDERLCPLWMVGWPRFRPAQLHRGCSSYWTAHFAEFAGPERRTIGDQVRHLARFRRPPVHADRGRRPRTGGAGAAHRPRPARPARRRTGGIVMDALDEVRPARTNGCGAGGWCSAAHRTARPSRYVVRASLQRVSQGHYTIDPRQPSGDHRGLESATWSETIASLAPSVTRPGRTCAECWSTRPSGTAATWWSWTAGIRPARCVPLAGTATVMPLKVRSWACVHCRNLP